jgi:hypothetical protein
MILSIYAEVWHCTACGLRWLPRDNSKEGVPARCPNRGCRKLKTYGRQTMPSVAPLIMSTFKTDEQLKEEAMKPPTDRMPDPYDIERGATAIEVPGASPRDTEDANADAFDAPVEEGNRG